MRRDEIDNLFTYIAIIFIGFFISTAICIGLNLIFSPFYETIMDIDISAELLIISISVIVGNTILVKLTVNFCEERKIVDVID